MVERRRQLFVVTSGVALVVLAAGWLTQLRVAMHTALLVVGVVLFWPLIALAAAIVASFILAIPLQHFAEPFARPMFSAAAGLIAGWARFVARQRHPLVVGIPCGRRSPSPSFPAKVARSRSSRVPRARSR